MNFLAANGPELVYPVLVSEVPLPNPQNHAASMVTLPRGSVVFVDPLQVTQLDALRSRSSTFARLLSEYLGSFARFSFAVSCTALPAISYPPVQEIRPRHTPFGHLNLVAPPVEGLFFDPDEFVEN